MPSISQFTANNMSYNGGEGPKLGYGNTLQFNISKNTTGRVIYYAVPALGLSENELYERESGQKTISFVLIPYIITYICICNKSIRYSTVIV